MFEQDFECRKTYCEHADGCCTWGGWKGWLLKRGCCWDAEYNDECDKSESCFPSSAKVPLEDGKLVSMAELHVGDRLKTGKKKSVTMVGLQIETGRNIANIAYFLKFEWN